MGKRPYFSEERCQLCGEILLDDDENRYRILMEHKRNGKSFSLVNSEDLEICESCYEKVARYLGSSGFVAYYNSRNKED